MNTHDRIALAAVRARVAEGLTGLNIHDMTGLMPGTTYPRWAAVWGFRV